MPFLARPRRCPNDSFIIYLPHNYPKEVIGWSGDGMFWHFRLSCEIRSDKIASWVFFASLWKIALSPVWITFDFVYFSYFLFLFSPLPIDEYIVRWSRVWTKCVCVDFLHILQRCDIFAICLRLCFPENHVCTTGNSISIWLQLPELFLHGISELLYNRNHKGNKNSIQGQNESHWPPGNTFPTPSHWTPIKAGPKWVWLWWVTKK